MSAATDDLAKFLVVAGAKLRLTANATDEETVRAERVWGLGCLLEVHALLAGACLSSVVDYRTLPAGLQTFVRACPGKFPIRGNRGTHTDYVPPPCA